MPQLTRLGLATQADQIHAALFLGPPVTMTVLSPFELARLRGHHGITLRNGAP